MAVVGEVYKEKKKYDQYSKRQKHEKQKGIKTTKCKIK